jgi:hypothetical protein
MFDRHVQGTTCKLFIHLRMPSVRTRTNVDRGSQTNCVLTSHTFDPWKCTSYLRGFSVQVLGIMGALDPHQHKRNQLTLQGPHGESGRTTGVESGTLTRSMEDLPVDIWPSGGLFTTSEEYYPTVAINALMRILRDPSLSSYHLKVVGSLMYVFKKMGLGCVPYLPKVMPDLFHTVRTCEEGLRDFIFWCLAALVSIVRQVCVCDLGNALDSEVWIHLVRYSVAMYLDTQDSLFNSEGTWKGDAISC